MVNHGIVDDDDNVPSPSPLPCPLPDSNATLALILLMTITMCLCHHPCPLPLDNDDEDDVARLQPNHVHSSTTTRLLLPPDPLESGRLPPTQPHQFKHDCSCPTSTVPSQAQSLFSDPTMSIQVQLLISCIHQALLSPATCLPPNHVNLSATTHILSSTRPEKA